MSKKITIKDLAKELNTTPSTVSRALNNNSRISSEMKKQVLDLAKKLNYRPNSVASEFRTGQSKTIGVIVPRINRTFFANAIHGIETIAAEAGYNIMICQSNESYLREVDYVKMLINNRVAGIIISISKETKDEKHIIEAQSQGIKVVQFDRTLENINSSIITNSNSAGAKEIVLHMLNQGYRKIALFHGILNNNVYCDRVDGYMQAHAEFGIEPNRELLFDDTITRDQGHIAAVNLLSRRDDFDSIFSCSDFAALGAFIHLKEQGVDIPKEVGIAGFANEPFTELTSPSITTSEQSSSEMGQLAAKQIIEEITVPTTINVHIQIPPKIKLRESTIKIKNG